MKEDVDPEQQRKFRMWWANTAVLLSEAAAKNQRSTQDIYRNVSNEVVRKALRSLHRLSASKNRDLADQLSDIIKEALDLDREISKQLAEITWDYPEKLPVKIDPQDMEVESGAKRPSGGEDVRRMERVGGDDVDRLDRGIIA